MADTTKNRRAADALDPSVVRLLAARQSAATPQRPREPRSFAPHQPHTPRG